MAYQVLKRIAKGELNIKGVDFHQHHMEEIIRRVDYRKETLWRFQAILPNRQELHHMKRMKFNHIG
ncbi:hypothetical protein CCACVL1_18091 [Corchorus capsularis]|uniref:Uncharacterized protein n=1 Tax=Corchorus capsularis TaxID=210143 RepID=A0A1R3HMY2_COCAP|nr:hypothetical protein CCACVL1_18091 [Corchorus capsularis]